MVSKLHYDPKYDKAMRYLFGKTLICRHLDAATKLARSTGLDCVTLDGKYLKINFMNNEKIIGKVRVGLEYSELSKKYIILF